MKSTLALSAALLLSAILVAPEIAAAAGEENPTPPASQNKSNKDTQTKKKKDKSSSAEDFLNGYHAAYKLIYDKSDYEGGIAALHALGYDDNADVATCLAMPAASSAAMTTPRSGTSGRSRSIRTMR